MKLEISLKMDGDIILALQDSFLKFLTRLRNDNTCIAHLRKLKYSALVTIPS